MSLRAEEPDPNGEPCRRYPPGDEGGLAGKLMTREGTLRGSLTPNDDPDGPSQPAGPGPGSTPVTLPLRYERLREADVLYLMSLSYILFRDVNQKNRRDISTLRTAFVTRYCRFCHSVFGAPPKTGKKNRNSHPLDSDVPPDRRSLRRPRVPTHGWARARLAAAVFKALRSGGAAR